MSHLLLFEYLEHVPKDFMTTLGRLKHVKKTRNNAIFTEPIYSANIVPIFYTVHPNLVDICGILMNFVGFPERDPSMNAWTY